MRKKLCFIKRFTELLLSFILSNSINAYGGNKNPQLSIITDNSPGQPVLHGLTKLTDALKSKNILFEKVESIDDAKGDWIIVTGLAYEDGLASQMLKSGNRDVPKVSEALTIWRTNWQKKPVWVISGFDDRGLMYALLDVADRIGWGISPKSPMSEVKEITEKPSVNERAVSMYTMNRTYWESRFYDENFWQDYLDMLARNRFNSLVVIFGYENGGFMAPCYPYFFDVDGFPDVRMVGLSGEEQQRNLQTINNLIKMAHDRGIKFTTGIKDHIYRGGIQGFGIQGSENALKQPTPGLVWGVTQDNFMVYTKAALTKFLKVIPELDGVLLFINNETGLTVNELQGFAKDFFSIIKENKPDLNFYIHSKGLTDNMIQSAVDLGLDFSISPKYWMEQMGMPWHPSHINRQDQMNRRHGYADMLRYPQHYKMHWRLWNGGTTRILLWGNPEFARQFAESSFLFNFDGGFDINEPLATKMHGQPHDAKPFDLLNSQYVYYNYEFERYWHFFQVFGRIGYNPNQSPDIWQKEFEIRFGKKAGPVVEKAIHEASWILPRIVASCYPYSCFPTTRGWPEKQRLGDLPGYASAEGSDIQQFANFDEEAQILIEGEESAKLLPSMTSLWFEQTSNSINNLVLHAEKVVGKNRNKEFNSTITDLKILSNLALYHSRRIPAAVSYRIFVRTKDVSALDKAIEYEKNAIEAWKQIVESAGNIYAENLMMGLQEAEFQGLTHRLTGHWKDELRYLEEGLKELEQQRLNFKPEGIVKNAPQYKVAVNADNSNFFQVSLQKVTGAPAGKPITVKVRVAVTSGIKWVRLRYRSVNQKEEYKTLEMKKNGDSFETTVPAEQIDPKYDFMYFIEVMDNSGNGKIYPDLNKETPYIIVKLIR